MGIGDWVFTEITSGASIENVGFVDTYVQTVTGLDLPDYATGFLAMRMSKPHYL